MSQSLGSGEAEVAEDSRQTGPRKRMPFAQRTPASPEGSQESEHPRPTEVDGIEYRARDRSEGTQGQSYLGIYNL